MGVDQERRVEIVAVLEMAAEMDLADMLHGECVEIGHGLAAVIDGGDVDVVDVEQEAAAGALDHAR